MGIGDEFQKFLGNIAVDNADTISLRYGEITAALNKEFRDTDSKTNNCLQVGSYGRCTAIRGVSDLDMIYMMPSSKWETYRNGGQYNLLRDAKDAIKARYPTTTVKVDRLVVRVLYKDFHVEVQPAFELTDGSFKYPDTKDGGSWKITKPREEIEELRTANAAKNRNLRRLCKMARSWKNRHGVYMGGLLIDTLAYNFLESTEYFDDKSYLYYDFMSRDFFEYLSDEADKAYYAAVGSGQHVKVKKKFQKKAKKAYDLCIDAIAASGQKNENDKWRKVFGRSFPKAETLEKQAYAHVFRDTEKFIEDMFRVDVRWNVQIDCEVTQNGFRTGLLRSMLERHLPLLREKKLRFHIVACDVPEPYTVYWKVLNRGDEAQRRDCIRGDIVLDKGHGENVETSDFSGQHIVECYVVKDNVVVARDEIEVPISIGNMGG